jgi:hypothetical protein
MPSASGFVRVIEPTLICRAASRSAGPRRGGPGVSSATLAAGAAPALQQAVAGHGPLPTDAVLLLMERRPAPR